MKSSLRVTEPDAARRVPSDGRFWSEIAAALEAIATRAAERGYVTDRLVLTASGTEARDTWKVELVTSEGHRARARELKANVIEVPAPERYIEFEPSKIPTPTVRAYCVLTRGEDTPIGRDRSRVELSNILRTANFAREQNNGFELWRAQGRGSKHGQPRWRLLVKNHKVRHVLPEHDEAVSSSRRGRRYRRPIAE